VERNLQKNIRKLTSSLAAILVAASLIPAAAFAETTADPAVPVNASLKIVESEALKDAFLNADLPEIEITDSVALPALPLLEAAGHGKLISFKSPNGSYTLPINQWDVERTAQQLGISIKDMTVHVQMNKASAEATEALAKEAGKINSTVVSDAVEYQLYVGSQATEQVQMLFQDIYTPHTFIIKKDLDSSKASGIMFDPDTKTISFVPALFQKDDNGNMTVTIKHTGNKVYSVIETSKTFGDIQDHWAKKSIELLANKLIVDGTTEATFEADRNITRAEFAALTVRALGLGDFISTESFSDVAADAWYSEVVLIASAAGLIDGFEDGTFRPNDMVTREQLAAIAVRATYYAGVATQLSDSKPYLDQYKDADQIVWAHDELAAAINARLIQGTDEQTINPAANVTRAEAVTVLRRILMLADFIE
jgi:N-acetylmuramoyl-L-alanine amidase